MSAWDDLVSTALIGTERRPPPPAVADEVAAVLGADPPAAPPEAAVLAAAGVLAAVRRAGWAPARAAGPAPEPAPPDDRPLAPAAAVQVLELVLEGQVALAGGGGPVVAEWLDRAAAGGRRPPERLLPRLLAAATADRGLRPATVAAGGPGLRWLAGRNPAWAWAAGPDVTSPPSDAAAVWTTGDRDGRTAALAALRASRPDAARALVEETWSGESARDRAAIVALLGAGLGPGDEPFLEAALDDRSKAVRQAAAALLCALPGSRLAARMADRLRPLVTTGGRLRKRLEVALPNEPDSAARRDGIVDEGAPARTGPRSWWLTQIVAGAPLGFWSDHLGLEPQAVVRMAGSPEVRSGLALAARRQRDQAWAAALLPHHPDPSLLTVLPPAEVAAAVGRLLVSTADARLPTLLDATPGPWSLDTSRAVVARVRAARSPGFVPPLLGVLASRLHPGAAGDVEAWACDEGPGQRDRGAVRGLLHALAIRQTIAQELS